MNNITMNGGDPPLDDDVGEAIRMFLEERLFSELYLNCDSYRVTSIVVYLTAYICNIPLISLHEFFISFNSLQLITFSKFKSKISFNNFIFSLYKISFSSSPFLSTDSYTNTFIYIFMYMYL